MALRNDLERSLTPLVVAGGAYLVLYVAIVVVIGLAAGSALSTLAGGGTVLPYFFLAGVFAVVVTVRAGRQVSRPVQALAGCLVVAGVGVRFVADTVGGVLSVLGLFLVVFLPYLVAGAVLLWVVAALGSPDRLRRLCEHRAVTGSVLVVGVALLVACVGPLLAVAAAPPAVPPTDWSTEEQLAYLERTDQADRETGAFVERSRDTARIERVLSLAAAGEIASPQAQLDAAVVLQHGTCPAHFELAHRYATLANDSPAVDRPFWVRATFDRWQLSLGNEQQYGTQSGTRPVNAACVPPVPDRI